MSVHFSDAMDSSSSSRSRSHYPTGSRNAMASSRSVYQVSALGTAPRFRTHSGYSGGEQYQTGTKKFRSNSSGCFLDTLELETPTPPPPPIVSTPSYFVDKPKYRFNGFVPKLNSAATDFTSAASPPSTPVPTPPPPPPLISSLKHFEYTNKKPVS